MKIAEITTRQVPTVNPDLSLHDACRLMQESDVTVLPVMQNGRLVGTVCEHELASRCCIEGCNPKRMTVGRVMNGNPAVCARDLPLRSALTQMQKLQRTDLIVVDPNGSVAGVVTLFALLDLLRERLSADDGDGPELGYVRRVRGGEPAL
ncbi:MAG: CBS domain-containing protein [Candidatus Thiodiazotropha sp.]